MEHWAINYLFWRQPLAASLETLLHRLWHLPSNAWQRFLQPPKPQMIGGGAASTDEAILRQQRALEQKIPLTKGEQLQDFSLLKRESDLPKENPELAKGLIEFKQGQKQSILKRFEELSEQNWRSVR
jgi:hypothetical protein